MAKNYVQEEEVLTMVAPTGGIKSGAGFLYGAMFGVAQHDALEGAPVEVGVVGCWLLPKPNSVITFAVGAPIYWDVSAGNCTSVRSTNYRIGIAIAEAGAADSQVSVRLDGNSTMVEGPNLSHVPAKEQLQ